MGKRRGHIIELELEGFDHTWKYSGRKWTKKTEKLYGFNVVIRTW